MGILDISITFIKRQRAVSMLMLGIVIVCVNFTTSVATADEITKTERASKKAEPPKQSGNFLIKFEANTSNARIDEVAEYYGANKVLALGDSEASTRKDPERWRKLRFDAVDDVKDIARRIFQDMSVDEVDDITVNK